MKRRNILAGLLASLMPIPKLPTKRLLEGTWTVALAPMEHLYHPDLDAITSAIAREIAREIDRDIINHFTQFANDQSLLHSRSPSWT